MKDVTTGKKWGQVRGIEGQELPAEFAGLLTGESQDSFFEVFYGQIQQQAQRILMQVLEAEVDGFIAEHQHLMDERGHRKVVRNGHAKPRQITTSVGNIEVEAPRVHSREEGKSFVSKILPPYMRRDPKLGDMVALLYLNGISTNKMPDVLEQYYGEGVSGVSVSSVTRMLEVCESEYKQWKERRLDDKRYVYLWADGIYFTLRSTGEKLCILTIIGVTPEGHKEVLAISPGQRESKLTWKEILLDLKSRGLEHPPKLAIADGALGFWSAVREVYPHIKEQRCWVHKIRNVLDKLPKSLQDSAKRLLHQIMIAPDKTEALRHYQKFIGLYEDKYPHAVECLRKDIDHLLTFYDFPAAHWCSIRSTNAIESTFSTVRRRTNSTGGRCTEDATVAMVYKLAMAAQSNWRRLNKYPFLEKVEAGCVFINGELAESEMTQMQKAA